MVSDAISSTVVVPPGTVMSLTTGGESGCVGNTTTRTSASSAPGADISSVVSRPVEISPPATTVGPDNGDAAPVNA